MTSAVALRTRSTASPRRKTDLTRSVPLSTVAPVRTLTLRQATPDDARAIHDLIARHLDEGRLLPRDLEEITSHANRFVVASDDTGVVGCVDLAPLSRTVAEVRSLVVSDRARSTGVGGRLIDALVARARLAGFDRLCAFTHAPAYFVQLGFSIVPHDWLPEKINADCGTCSLFRRCGQYAVVLSLPLACPERANASRRASRHG